MTDFIGKFTDIQNEKPLSAVLFLSPVVIKMPVSMRRYDDPFLPFGKAIIQATQDLVCGYVFDFAAYLAIGAAGAVALERSIAYVGDDCFTVLHGAFANKSFYQLLDETSFNADALTIINDNQLLEYAISNPAIGTFIQIDNEEDDNVTLNKVGIFNTTKNNLSFSKSKVMIIGDELIYADQSTDDFYQQIRENLMERISE